jgi:hypothetical protein
MAKRFAEFSPDVKYPNPRPKLHKRDTGTFRAPVLDHIVVDIYKKDELPFDGILPSDCLKLFWSKLGRETREVREISSKRFPKRYLRASFKLRSGLPVVEVTKSHESTVEIKLGNSVHHFDVRFPQFRDLKGDLDSVVTVTFRKVLFPVTSKDLRSWISLFGKIKGPFR